MLHRPSSSLRASAVFDDPATPSAKLLSHSVPDNDSHCSSGWYAAQIAFERLLLLSARLRFGTAFRIFLTCSSRMGILPAKADSIPLSIQYVVGPDARIRGDRYIAFWICLLSSIQIQMPS